MFQNIGTPEILVIILLLVIIFGGNKVSEVAKGLGEATREVKKAKKDLEITQDELKKEPKIQPETETKPVSKPKKKKLKKHPIAKK